MVFYTKAVFDVVSSSAVEAVAPRLWAYEIRNSVLMGLRRSRISKPDSEQLLVSLNELNVRLTEQHRTMICSPLLGSTD